MTTRRKALEIKEVAGEGVPSDKGKGLPPSGKNKGKRKTSTELVSSDTDSGGEPLQKKSRIKEKFTPKSIVEKLAKGSTVLT